MNNKETKRLIDSLTQFKNKIATLNKSIDDIMNTSSAVIKKLPLMEAYYEEFKQRELSGKENRQEKLQLI